MNEAATATPCQDLTPEVILAAAESTDRLSDVRPLVGYGHSRRAHVQPGTGGRKIPEALGAVEDEALA